MNKQEALERLDALEAEAKKLREIIDAPEIDESKWIGRWGFTSGADSSCPNDGQLSKLESIANGGYFYITRMHSWRYFRPATLKELGVMEFFKELPEAANWIYIHRDGDMGWAGHINRYGHHGELK